MAWRTAKSLLTLRAQINEQWPKRRMASDGTIGDSKHASRSSDHNPHVKDGSVGVVTAMDITHDTLGGPDGAQLARALITDPRIKYVIWDRKIYNPSIKKAWRAYVGQNPHTHHVHVSVWADKKTYDSTAPWQLSDITILPVPSFDPPQKKRPVLRKGSKGQHVRDLQRLLNIKVDGSFGSKTLAAVKAFQKTKGLVVDGKVGPYTWEALEAKAPSEAPAPFPVKSEPQWAVSFLRSLGWSHMDAVVWVANIVWESGGNRNNTIIWDAHGDKGKDGKYHSHGGAQWNDKHGRFQGLIEYAKARGMEWTDREAQMRYLHSELFKTEWAAAQRVRTATTLEDKMKAALTFWRPSVPHADKRLAIARNLMTTILPPERQPPESLTGLGAYAAPMETEMTDHTKTVTMPGAGRVEVEDTPGWTNWRTLAINALMAMAIPLVTFLSTVDWTQYVPATYAVYFVIFVNVIMRFLTAGPAMSNVTVKKL